MTDFNPLEFIAGHAGMCLADAIKEAYEQGKRDALEPKKIAYKECAEALIKMWMDDILTDSEYVHIMYKLNKNLKKEG